MADQGADALAQNGSELSVSLAEYSSRMSEMHHRIKNNLQVILSLFSMKADRTTSPEVRELLVEMQSRVRAIAYLHHPRYSTNNFSTIHVADYLNSFLR